MAALGNVFTAYNYEKSDISLRQDGPRLEVTSSTGLDVSLEVPSGGECPLPAGSPFPTWREARLFSGPLPFTFSVDEARGRVVIVEGSRQRWHPAPLIVRQARVPFLESLGFSSMTLANAFRVADIPYHWKKGRQEVWKP